MRNTKIICLGIFAVLLFLTILGFQLTSQLTGRVIGQEYSDGTIVRAPVEIDGDLGVAYVKLIINFSTNILFISENFSSEDCFVYDYYLNQKIDTSMMDEFEPKWILADDSGHIDLELTYVIDSTCDVLGEPFVLDINHAKVDNALQNWLNDIADLGTTMELLREVFNM